MSLVKCEKVNNFNLKKGGGGERGGRKKKSNKYM